MGVARAEAAEMNTSTCLARMRSSPWWDASIRSSQEVVPAFTVHKLKVSRSPKRVGLKKSTVKCTEGVSICL